MTLQKFISNLNQVIIKTYTIPIVHYDIEEVKRIYIDLTNLRNVWISQYESFLIYDTPEVELLKRRIELIEKKLDDWLLPYVLEEIDDIIKFQNPDEKEIYKSYLENIPALISSLAFGIELNLKHIRDNYLKEVDEEEGKNKTRVKLTRLDKIKKVLIDFADDIKDTKGKGRIFVASLCYLFDNGITERFSYQGIKDFLGANIVEGILAEGTYHSHWNNLKGSGGDKLRDDEINIFRKKFKSIESLKALKRVNPTNLYK